MDDGRHPDLRPDDYECITEFVREGDFTVARPDNAVSVNFSVGSLQAITRSNAIATDDTQRQFNQGEQISVSTNDQEAVLFQCTSTDDQRKPRRTDAALLSKKNSVLWASPEKHHRLSIARASSALHSAQVFFEPM